MKPDIRKEKVRTKFYITTPDGPAFIYLFKNKRDKYDLECTREIPACGWYDVLEKAIKDYEEAD